MKTVVPLKTLLDAVEQLKFLLFKAEPALTGDEFKKAMNAYSELHAEVVHLTQNIKVGVEA